MSLSAAFLLLLWLFALVGAAAIAPLGRYVKAFNVISDLITGSDHSSADCALFVQSRQNASVSANDLAGSICRGGGR